MTERESHQNDAETKDDLKLEIEEVADLDVPAGEADDVRGASGTRHPGSGPTSAGRTASGTASEGDEDDRA